MALVLKSAYHQLVEFTEKYPQDPRVKGYPLVGAPASFIIVLILYIFFVKKWGPNWMIDRKPFNVKFLIQVHNILQIVLNAYVFVFAIWNSYLRKDFNLTCNMVDFNDKSPATMRLLDISYIYYILKYLDLFDTVFFVLRKKDSQVTFLHVYHHSVMIFAVWVYLTYLFASDFTMLGIMNSFVHVVMYTYYMVSSLDLKIDLDPWKKRVTQVQIVQFCLLSVHFMLPIFGSWCNSVSTVIYGATVIQNIFMAVMFSDFYYRAYLKKAKNGKKIT